MTAPVTVAAGVQAQLPVPVARVRPPSSRHAVTAAVSWAFVSCTFAVYELAGPAPQSPAVVEWTNAPRIGSHHAVAPVNMSTDVSPGAAVHPVMSAANAVAERNRLFMLVTAATFQVSIGPTARRVVPPHPVAHGQLPSPRTAVVVSAKHATTAACSSVFDSGALV